MLSANKVHHTVGNITSRTFNYAPWLVPGEIVTDAAMVSSSTTLLVTNVTVFQGREVRYQTTGGLDGETATITVTVNTNKTERKIEAIEVLVSAP